MMILKPAIGRTRPERREGLISLTSLGEEICSYAGISGFSLQLSRDTVECLAS